MKSILTVLLFAVSTLTLQAISASTRIWTSSDGQSSFEGVFVKATEQEVTITRTEDGETFHVPLERFSEHDKEWVINKLAELSKEITTPTRQLPERLEWPRHVRIPSNYSIEVVEEDRQNNRFIYHSEHFEFISDVPLSRRTIRDFGKVFEATFLAVAAMPLRWDPQPPDNGDRFPIRLFGTREAYHEAGGPEQSGGVFTGREVLVPLTSVGMRRTSSEYTFTESSRFGTLIHEVTHQVHGRWLRRLPIWLIEGLAVYTPIIPYSDGEFRFDRADFITYYKARHGNDVIAIETLFSMSYAEWIRQNRSEREFVGLNYGTSMLMTWFFFHYDNDGLNMYQYLRAIEEGVPEEEARKYLLAGRTVEELQRDFIRALERNRFRANVVQGITGEDS